MSVFRYSTQFMRDQLNSNNSISSLGHLTNTEGLRDNSAALYVMKGTIPTQNELDNFSASSWRSGDALFGRGVAGSNTNAPFDATNGIIGVAYARIAATQSGTASWFQWRGGRGSNALCSPTFIGTITLPGGGGDMSLTTLNIVAGSWYNIGPASWVFNKRDYTY